MNPQGSPTTIDDAPLAPAGELSGPAATDRRPPRWAVLGLAGMVAVLGAGCSKKQVSVLPPPFIGREVPPELVTSVRRMGREGERNWVLNLNQTAIAALRIGDRETARVALDEAILQIEAIYGNTPEASKARMLFYTEDTKLFKGDPYERTMTYFYRGVLAMQDREWDTAAAAFRGGILQDAFAEDSQANGDWSTMDYLIGVCEIQRRRDSYAKDAFALAAGSYTAFAAAYPTLAGRPELWRGNEYQADVALYDSLPEFDPNTNLLVITQQGRSPRKVAAGEYGELLTFAPGGGGDVLPTAAWSGAPLPEAFVTDSLYYQAITRGGRETDGILARKANFKKVTEVTGQVGIGAGAVMIGEGLRRSHNDDDNGDAMAAAGAAVLAVGLLSTGVSALTTPKADTRTWRSLPDTIAVLPAVVPGGPGDLALTWPGYDESSAETSTSPLVLDAPGTGLTVVLAFAPPGPVAVVPGMTYTPSLEFSSEELEPATE